MKKRPLLLVDGRWARLDEVSSLYRTDADATAPVRGGITYTRKGKPSMVYRVAGLVELSTRRSGRQLIAITANQEQ